MAQCRGQRNKTESESPGASCSIITLPLKGGRVPWLGRLPGDIFIQRGNFSFYFPLTTSVLVSVLVSLLFFLLRR